MTDFYYYIAAENKRTFHCPIRVPFIFYAKLGQWSSSCPSTIPQVGLAVLSVPQTVTTASFHYCAGCILRKAVAVCRNWGRWSSRELRCLLVGLVCSVFFFRDLSAIFQIVNRNRLVVFPQLGLKTRLTRINGSARDSGQSHI